MVRLTSRGVAQVESDPMLARQIRSLLDGGGKLSFHRPPGELSFYTRFFASFGAEATVLEPGALRQGLLGLGLKLVELYKK